MKKVLANLGRVIGTGLLSLCMVAVPGVFAFATSNGTPAFDLPLISIAQANNSTNNQIDAVEDISQTNNGAGLVFDMQVDDEPFSQVNAQLGEIADEINVGATVLRAESSAVQVAAAANEVTASSNNTVSVENVDMTANGVEVEQVDIQQTNTSPETGRVAAVAHTDSLEIGGTILPFR